MSRHNLMRIATLATIAGCATPLFGPTALGQPDSSWTQVPPPSLFELQLQFPGTRTWVGSASCHVTATSPKDNTSYSGDETHTWTIIPWVIYTNTTKSMAFYAENWTATGTGGDGTRTWTVNATGKIKDAGGNYFPAPGYLAFWLPPNSGLLNIARFSAGQTDPSGSTGGLSASVGEIAFPGPVLPTNPSGSDPVFQTIVADPNIKDSVKGTSSNLTHGSILSNEPGDGVNNWTCQWDFEYPPLHVQPLPPKSLVKPPGR
jgi:hypothetical protein